MCAACEILAGFSFQRCVVLLKKGPLSSYPKSDVYGVVNEQASGAKTKSTRGNGSVSFPLTRPRLSAVRIFRLSITSGNVERRRRTS